MVKHVLNPIIIECELINNKFVYNNEKVGEITLTNDIAHVIIKLEYKISNLDKLLNYEYIQVNNDLCECFLFEEIGYEPTEIIHTTHTVFPNRKHKFVINLAGETIMRKSR